MTTCCAHGQASHPGALPQAQLVYAVVHRQNDGTASGQQLQARATAILHARGAESILQAQHIPCQHACASSSCALAVLMLAPLIAGVPTVAFGNHRRMPSPTELKREARRRHCCCHRLAFGALLRHVAACTRIRPLQGGAHRVRIKAASSFPFDFYFVGHRPI